PLEPTYVSALQSAGYAVYGQSRWFNRVAVHASGAPLLGLAAFPFVRQVAPVELAQPRAREPEGEPVSPARTSFREPSLPAAAQTIYGRTLGQLSRLNIPAVHDSGYIGFGVTVAMLDNGFNWYRKHEALKTIPVGGS